MGQGKRFMELAHIFLSSGHNYFGHHGKPPGDAPMVEVDRARCVAGKGLEGDRFFDWKPDYKGQVTFFEMETVEWLEKALGVRGRPVWVFRRNVLTRGLRLNGLIGKEFEIQGVRFLGTEEAKPCYWMDSAFAEGAEAALRGRGGLRVKVLSDGWLTRGAFE
jgi:MOSC domain-containing protein YiiM